MLPNPQLEAQRPRDMGSLAASEDCGKELVEYLSQTAGVPSCLSNLHSCPKGSVPMVPTLPAHLTGPKII